MPAQAHFLFERSNTNEIRKANWIGWDGTKSGLWYCTSVSLYISICISSASFQFDWTQSYNIHVPHHFVFVVFLFRIDKPLLFRSMLALLLIHKCLRFACVAAQLNNASHRSDIEIYALYIHSSRLQVVFYSAIPFSFSRSHCPCVYCLRNA